MPQPQTWTLVILFLKGDAGIAAISTIPGFSSSANCDLAANAIRTAVESLGYDSAVHTFAIQIT